MTLQQTFVEFPDSQCRRVGVRRDGFSGGLVTGSQWLAALFCGTATACVFAFDTGIDLRETSNPVVQAYSLKLPGQRAAVAANHLTIIEHASGPPEAPFFTAIDSTQCREKQFRFCRDLARSEFRVTSLRFMVPEVRGLTPKSLSIRRNSVVANYTFR